MNKVTYTILIGILVALAVLIGIDIAPEPQIVKLGEVNQFYDGVTNTSVSISITATGTTEALARNYAAVYRRLQNTGATLITCQLDDATSTLTSGKGIVLNSSTTNSIYEMDLGNLYQGQIRCLSDTSTGTLSVVEK